MNRDLQVVTQEVFELERSLNERWSSGDNRGYLDNYHEDSSYFDPVLDRLLIGREVVVEHIQKLYKNPRSVRSEYLNPHVIASEAGDLAVLSYNLRSYVVDANGAEQLLRAWNATEVYRKIADAWRIVHSNWAITRSLSMPIAS
ncbi:YybH family protein [Variovorax sp. ZT4R33]|uniref:YybH family protein n=1 Tax=Variovorax sp. ZT4R33 TaxID=3443743 RepID=UPI003F46E4C9